MTEQPNPDYHTTLLFSGGVLVAAELKDDYTEWLDLEGLVAGSNLSDGNNKYADSDSMEDSIELYLESLKDSIVGIDGKVVRTNDVEACERWLVARAVLGFEAINDPDGLDVRTAQAKAKEFYAQDDWFNKKQLTND